MTARNFLPPLLIAAVAGLIGCDNSMGRVNGEVTVDGKPLAEGTIRFERLDGNGPTAGALIKDGRFSADVSRGANRVEINAWEVIPPAKPTDEATTRELLPAKYNTKSGLVYEVGSRSAEARFDLESK